MFKYCLLLFTLSFSGNVFAQDVRVVKFNAVEQLIKKDNDTTYIINFFATWCKPCMHEIGGFVKIDSAYKNKKVKVILISLDFVKDLDTKVKPLLIKNKIKSTVWLLNAPDYNSWIDKVDTTWGGAIPATLIVNNKKHFRSFHEDELNYNELNNIIKPFIKSSEE